MSIVVIFARRECGNQLRVELRMEYVSCYYKTGRLQTPRSTIEHVIAFDGISYEVSTKMNTLANTQDQKRDMWSFSCGETYTALLRNTYHS